MTQLSVGDVVKLKSGGPRMTVVEKDIGPDNDEVECKWFNKVESSNSYSVDVSIFPVAALVKMTD